MTPDTLPMTELELQDAVVQLALTCRWRLHHCRPAMTARGWRTPITGTAGFPDLILVRNQVLLVRELKSERGMPSPEQIHWLSGFRRAGVDADVWRPSDWRSGRIEAALR